MICENLLRRITVKRNASKEIARSHNLTNQLGLLYQELGLK